MRTARLYLRLGDRVYHCQRREWGIGAVVEEMTSIVEGGTCLVRVLFEDGVQRTFNNDLDSDTCCYFFGIRRERVARPRTAAGTRRVTRAAARDQD